MTEIIELQEQNAALRAEVARLTALMDPFTKRENWHVFDGALVYDTNNTDNADPLYWTTGESLEYPNGKPPYMGFNMETTRMKAEISRLRAALEHYAARDRWGEFNQWYYVNRENPEFGGWQIAADALEGAQ